MLSPLTETETEKQNGKLKTCKQLTEMTKNNTHVPSLPTCIQKSVFASRRKSIGMFPSVAMAPADVDLQHCQ